MASLASGAEEDDMGIHRFTVNGRQVEVDVEDDTRVLWVLRDILRITGPKYGCGLSICQSCTSHINGQVFNPCSVRVGDLRDDDEITTIEGLADTVPGDGLHPVQQVWIEDDVAQCGFCQPGQIMAAVGLIERVLAEGRSVTDADLDALRNVCRCGTYPRVRDAIRRAAEVMAVGIQSAGAPAQAPVDDDALTQRLPATGGTSLLGPAAAAVGTAVTVRAARSMLVDDDQASSDEAQPER